MRSSITSETFAFRNGDIVLHYTFGDLPAVLKHIPWLQEMAKTIQALCFDTTGTWLLVVSK